MDCFTFFRLYFTYYFSMDRFLKRKYDDGEDVGSSSSKGKIRKFNDEYLQYGFVVIESEGEQKGQCVEVG